MSKSFHSSWPAISTGNFLRSFTHANGIITLLFAFSLFHVSPHFFIPFSPVFNLEIGKAGDCSEHHLWEVWEDSCLQPEEVQSVWWDEWREHDRAFVQVRCCATNASPTVYFFVIIAVWKYSFSVKVHCHLQHFFGYLVREIRLVCSSFGVIHSLGVSSAS